jgi:hypothetical protein
MAQQPPSTPSRTPVEETAAPAAPAGSYDKPSVKTLDQRDVLSAVKKGSKFPSRGFAG